jgi:hypothetical protein
MVCAVGFEPTTSRVQGENSDQAELHADEGGSTYDYPQAVCEEEDSLALADRPQSSVSLRAEESQ